MSPSINIKSNTPNGICIPLGDCTMQELLKNLRRAAKSADFIEIRADRISGFSLAALLKRETNTPLIFTCYAKSKGGSLRSVGARGHVSLSSFAGSETERIKLLLSAITSGRFEYVTIDVPESLKISDTVKTLIDMGRRCRTKIILAYHNYQWTPGNLERIYNQLSVYKPAVVKIVTYANNFSDNFRIFKLAQRVTSRRSHPPLFQIYGVAKNSPKLIAFCMGNKGLISRILYKKFGLFLTYASYKTGLETADGQIPFDIMKYIYRADSINRRTRIFGLLGNPIKHSYGPILFNALFKTGNINAIYLPFAIDPRYFRRDFSLIKSFLQPQGFSVTSPYKIAAMRLVDKLSKSAKEIGAVNTIYREGHAYRPECFRGAGGRSAVADNKLIGTNTDWIGVIEALLPLRKLINNRHALILGKGGASRAIIYALRHSGIKTTIFARSDAHEPEGTACNERSAPYPRKASGRKSIRNILPLRQLPRYCRGLGRDKIIINATPVGMFPETGKSPVPKSCLKKGMIVFDTIYNPTKTRLIKDARSRGCFAINGLKMFLVQALKQLECFTRSVSR